MSYTARSLLLKCYDNWGNTASNAAMAIRSLDMYLEGSLVPITLEDLQFWGSTSVNVLDRTAKNLIISSLSKIGSGQGTEWSSAEGVATQINQIVGITFLSAKTFDSLVVNNRHWNGGSTNEGVKNVDIYLTDSVLDAENMLWDTTLPNDSLLIYTGEFREHISSNVVDSEELVLIPSVAYSLNGVIKNVDGSLATSQPFQVIKKSVSGILELEKTGTTDDSGSYNEVFANNSPRQIIPTLTENKATTFYDGTGNQVAWATPKEVV